MLKLRINPIVAKDLKKIRDYIAEDNEEYATKTIKEIYVIIYKFGNKFVEIYRVVNRYQDITRIFE